MTQQILMILPATEDEAPRLVGPFLTEATAAAWADRKEIDPDRRVIRPLESPTSIYGYGRHALIPSPTPRNVAAGALAAWEEKKAAARRRSDGGISGVLEGIYGLPEPPETMNFTGGIRHWVTGEAMESAPRNVMANAVGIGHWSGPVARFNHPTTDGRVLQFSSGDVADWLPHFVRVPVGVWVIMPDFGPLPIGLCERVRVEDGWLLAEGRVSLAHFEKAAPALFRQATDSTLDQSRGIIPAAIDVTGGQRGYSAGEHIIGRGWELERVVFGSVPAWPGCYVRLGAVELESRRG